MRLEEEYRRRLHEVTSTVKRRLDYQVDVEQAQKKFEQEHMIQWLEGKVTELVKGKQVSLKILKRYSVFLSSTIASSLVL